ncbi:hypothetical protein NBRC111894_705 [Sporolactobacillus inulinus]|uniref:Uncharacterized protein n=1 Tax=Sporolactobacillus inulinus TaxID=2078 RepID=A0A4Y1Z8D2_9BACL|nr:hypothetical protein NBRC111894_705 [Sporolactobacillus inulinus]
MIGCFPIATFTFTPCCNESSLKSVFIFLNSSIVMPCFLAISSMVSPFWTTYNFTVLHPSCESHFIYMVFLGILPLFPIEIYRLIT